MKTISLMAMCAMADLLIERCSSREKSLYGVTDDALQAPGAAALGMANALSPTMTLREFANGYWYLDQLKDFAERIGIPAAKKLRKDELETAIVTFLRTGNAALPTKRSLRRTGEKDVARGLSLKVRIENYTSNRETKDFIIDQARSDGAACS